LEPGSAYVSEIVDSDVWINRGQRFLGRVSEVRFGAGEAPLLVVKLPVCAVQNEVLVPFAEEFVKKFDLAAKRIDMELPEGLLEVDAPLSEEEKQRQKSEADEARAAGESKKGK
jgi:16S rRNA processing protein RimM